MSKVADWKSKASILLQTHSVREVADILFDESSYSEKKTFKKKIGIFNTAIKKAGYPQSKEVIKSFIGLGEHKQEWDEKGNNAVFSYVGEKQITTLEEALSHCNVDKDIWEVERHVFNSWQTTLGKGGGDYNKSTNYQVKIWFKRKLKEIAQRNFAAELKAELKSVSPIVLLKKRSHFVNGKLLEIDIFDPHFGKLAWGEETGENYDITIAEERYMTALSELLHRASGGDRIEKILFPIGNDLMHTDTTTATTTGNTQQDVDVRWQKMWLRTRAAIMRGIKMATEVAPVEIVIVPSNHDFQTIFYLGDLLECYYQNNKNITVHNSPKTRKYYRFGKCGIGFTHGNEENHNDLAIIMLREMQKEWGDVEYMEWHLGHFQKKKGGRFKSSDDYKGIMVRLLRSLSSADSWHARRGYVSTIKGAEAFIWDKEYGVTANLMHNL